MAAESRRIAVHAAVDMSQPARRREPITRHADLGRGLCDEVLSPEAGHDGHHHDRVQLLQEGPHHVDGRGRAHRQTGTAAARADGGERLRDELAGLIDLDVEGDRLRSGLQEARHVARRLGDHEVDVQWE